jgi:hypothetical protein
MEREAQADIEAGRVKEFETAAEAIEFLHKSTTNPAEQYAEGLGSPTRFQKAIPDAEQIRKKVDRQILRLGENIYHPSLQSKPIRGSRSIRGGVDQNYRMTCERLPGDILLLRVVGKHQEIFQEAPNVSPSSFSQRR